MLEANEPGFDTLIQSQSLSEGSHMLKVYAIDKSGSAAESTVSFMLAYGLEESEDLESFITGPLKGWSISGWSQTAFPAYDDQGSLRSSSDYASAITRKEYKESGSISFYVKNGAGNMNFLVDGELKAKWFAKENWGYYAYTIPAGNHVFRWECEAEDTYLDQVVFTPGLEQHTPGEVYGGGTIFYLDSTGLHGLIAAFQDGNYEGIFEIPWGCYGLNILSGNRARSYTDGEGNTRAIVQDCTMEQIAARYCSDLTTFHDDSIQDDWYLPAITELNTLYSNRAILDDLNGEYYWSSTSFTSTAASVYNFIDGSHHGAHRNIPNVNGPVAAEIHVRPIRNF